MEGVEGSKWWGRVHGVGEGGNGTIHGDGREKIGRSQSDEWEEGGGKGNAMGGKGKMKIRGGGGIPPTHPVVMREREQFPPLGYGGNGMTRENGGMGSTMGKGREGN